MSKIKEYYMEKKNNSCFGDLEREYLFNDVLAQEDGFGYESFVNSPDYKESNIVKKAKIILGHGREIQVDKEEFIFDTADSTPKS